MTEKKEDVINSPNHYCHGEIECIDYLKDNLGMAFGFFLEGSIKKYMHRFRHKHDTQEGKLNDLRKAQYFLNALIADGEKHDFATAVDPYLEKELQE